MTMCEAEHPPSAPRHLRYSFVITSVNITVQLGWQPPSAGDVTGYRVTCARAGPHWYTDRRTLITTVLSSVSAVWCILFSVQSINLTDLRNLNSNVC